MGGNEQSSATAMRAKLFRVAGMVLVLAFVASWFVWGPFGVVLYVGGLLNWREVFMVILLLFLLFPVAAICMVVVGIDAVWRRLTSRQKVVHSGVVVASGALVGSFCMGFTGLTPAPFDMFVRGFAQYVENRTDVAAIQNWLRTLDPNDCDDTPLEAKVAPGVHPQNPPKYVARPACLAPFRSGGARLHRDEAGRPFVSLVWGGGLIGHWGIRVGDKSMQPPPNSEVIGYQPLAPGAWVWYELD